MLEARMVTRSKFRTEGPQFWSNLWTCLLSGAVNPVIVNRYILMYVRKRIALNVLKILGASYKILSPGICASPVSFVTKLNSDVATTQENHLTNFIQLKQLLANFSLRIPGFNPRADYVGFLVDKVVLDLFEYFGSSTNAPHSSSTEKQAFSETPVFCSRMTRKFAW